MRLKLTVLISCLATVLLNCANGAQAAPDGNKESKENNESQPPAKKFTSVTAAIQEFGTPVRTKLKPLFESLNITYPPKNLTWITLKQEKQLLVFAKDSKGANRKVLSYPIIGASGTSGLFLAN